MAFTLGDIALNFRARTSEVDAAFDRMDSRVASFAGANRDRLVSHFTGEAGGLQATMGQAEGGLRSWGERVRGFLISSLTIPVGGFLGGLVGTVKNMVTGSVIGMNASLEKSTIQFTTLMGDAEKAKAHVKMLFTFAKDTPFETQPIIAASRTLQTFGGAALNNVDQLTMVGNAAAAATQDISRVSFWWGQMYSKIQGQQPFGEAAYAMQEMGIVSPAVLEQLKAMQKSGASSAEVWAFFTKNMHTFDGAMKAQAQTWEGLTSTISDALAMIGAVAGKPLFDLAKMGLTTFANFISSPIIGIGADLFARGLQAIIDAALRLVAPFGAILTLLGTGTFTGGIFGLKEDSPLIQALIRINGLFVSFGAALMGVTPIIGTGAEWLDTLAELVGPGIAGAVERGLGALLRFGSGAKAAWGAAVFGFQTGGITGAMREVVTSLFGIEGRFGPLGQAIQRFDGLARTVFDRIRLPAKALWGVLVDLKDAFVIGSVNGFTGGLTNLFYRIGMVNPLFVVLGDIVARIGDMGDRIGPVFTSLGAALLGVTPIIGSGAEWLDRLALVVGDPMANAVETGLGTLLTVGRRVVDLFISLGAALTGVTPLIGDGAEWLDRLSALVGPGIAGAVERGVSALVRFGSGIRDAWEAVVVGFQTGGITEAIVMVLSSLFGIDVMFGDIAQAVMRLGAVIRSLVAPIGVIFRDLVSGDFRGALDTLWVTLKNGYPRLILAGRDLAGALVASLAAKLPEGLRSKVPVILAGITSVFAGLNFGPAIAGLFASLAPVGAMLAPIGAMLGSIGAGLGWLGGFVGGLLPSVGGLGAAFLGLLNPMALLSGLFTHLGVVGLMMLHPIQALHTILPMIASGWPGLLSVLTKIGPLLMNLGGSVLGLISPLGIIIGLVALFAGAFATNFGGIQDIVFTMLGPVMPVLAQLGYTIQDVLTALMSGEWAGAFSILQAGFAQITTLLGTVATSFQTGLPMIFGVLMQLLGQIGVTIIGWIGAYLPGLITALGGMAMAFIGWVVPMIPPILASLATLFTQLLGAVGAAVPGIVAALAGFVAAFVDWVLVAGPPMLIQLGGIIAGLLAWAAAQVPGIAAQLGTWATEFLGWVAPLIPKLIITLGTLLAGFLGWIGEKAPDVLAKLGEWATQFITWATTVAGPALKTALGTMFTGLWTELQTLWGAAFADGSLGATLLRTLRQDIIDGWDNFSSWFVAKLTSAVPDFLKGPLGIPATPAPAPEPPAPAPGEPHRAGGGPVTKGQRYVVGEEGPEFFVAPADGVIEPHGVYAAATRPLATVMRAMQQERVAAPPASAAAPAASAPAPDTAAAAGHTFNIAFTFNNPVVDTPERLMQLKQAAVAEAVAQFTAALNRHMLGGR